MRELEQKNREIILCSKINDQSNLQIAMMK